MQLLASHHKFRRLCAQTTREPRAYQVDQWTLVRDRVADQIFRIIAVDGFDLFDAAEGLDDVFMRVVPEHAQKRRRLPPKWTSDNKPVLMKIPAVAASPQGFRKIPAPRS